MEATHFQLNYVYGVVALDEAERFERMVFRVSKGNVWIQFFQTNLEQYIYDLEFEEQEKISIFAIMFSGG